MAVAQSSIQQAGPQDVSVSATIGNGYTAPLGATLERRLFIEREKLKGFLLTVGKIWRQIREGDLL